MHDFYKKVTPGPELYMSRPFFSVVLILAAILPRLLDFQEGST